MEAGKRPITEIFNGSHVLEIPLFQRAYVWDADAIAERAEFLYQKAIEVWKI